MLEPDASVLRPQTGLSLLAILLFMLCDLVGCSSPERLNNSSTMTKYKTSVIVQPGQIIRFQEKGPPRATRSGEPSACLRGSYYHRFETTGEGRNREVLLCCVPVEELLKDSFPCSTEIPMFAIYNIQGHDYAKLRSCYLQHPTSPKTTFLPVCVPAPLQIEDLKP